MNSLPVPKYLNWPSTQSIQQHWNCDFDCLITSGCSFTSSTFWLEGAASWPGYVRDRCGIPVCIDMSFSGVGNLYIADSIKYAIENYCKSYSPKKILVIVMWSGIDRVESVCLETSPLNGKVNPCLGNKFYCRETKAFCTQESAVASKEIILNLKQYLEELDITLLFTSYANVLFSPFVPKRDTTGHFPDFLTKTELNQLESIPWIPNNGMDYLYEWAWKNEFLNTGDYFHPPNEANFQWTDEILLPQMAERNLITEKPISN